MSDSPLPGFEEALQAGQAAFPCIDGASLASSPVWRRALERGGVAFHDPERAADLFLSAACEAGVAGAWEAFGRAYAPRLHGLLRKRGASEAETADVLADLPGYLCEPPATGGARTRIGTYDGTGRLFAWLAVLALRTVNQRRSAGGPRPSPIEAAADVSSRRGGPASSMLSTETARRFQAAVAAAWDTLTPRERLVVLWKHREGLKGGEIARLLRIGEPRVSRILESGLSRLREAVRRQMPDTPPGTNPEDESVWRALSGVLSRHLARLSLPTHDPGGSPDA